MPPAGGTTAPERDTDPQSAVSDLSEVRQVMHDIRNHLNGILGLVRVLLLQWSDPTSMRPSMHEIRTARIPS